MGIVTSVFPLKYTIYTVDFVLILQCISILIPLTSLFPSEIERLPIKNPNNCSPYLLRIASLIYFGSKFATRFARRFISNTITEFYMCLYRQHHLWQTNKFGELDTQ